MVSSSIAVHSVINVGSNQEAITIPQSHLPKAGMCQQALLRMTFTSPSLQMDDVWEPAFQGRASKSPFTALIGSEFWKEERAFCLDLGGLGAPALTQLRP